MPDISKLAEYGLVGIIIACLGLIAWLVKYFLDQMKNNNETFQTQMAASDQRHCDAYEKLTLSLDKNTEVTSKTGTSINELSVYLKARNGSDRHIIEAKVEEILKKNG